MTMRGFVVLVALTASLVAGCGAPDREAEADALGAAVETMPGVERAHVVYSNDFTSGTNIHINVRLSDATSAQIEAVAQRVAESFTSDFDGFRQDVRFTVEGGTVTFDPTRGEDELLLDPVQVASDVGAVRQMAERMPATKPDRQIRWERRGDQSELWLTGPATRSSLAAVREAVDEQEVRATFPAYGESTLWTVEYPFSGADESEVRSRLDRIESEVFRVRVDGPAIAALEVTSPASPASARAALDEIVELIEPTRAHPLMLEWDEDPRGRGQERRLRGTVHVQGCDYDGTALQTEPEKFLTDEALTLQESMRKEYDAC